MQEQQDGDKLSEDELLSIVVVLYVAGHITTVNLIGNSVAALALLAGGALAACLLSFQSGGYRGMGAFAGLVVLAYLGGGSLHGARAGQLIIGGLAGLALAGPSLLAAWWIPKGPYLIYGLSAGVALWLLVNLHLLVASSRETRA